MPSIFKPEIQEVLDTLLKDIPGVVPSKAFGYPAYSIGKKMFACVYEEGVSLKLPRERIAEIMAKDSGAKEFRPMNRHTMKDWVLLIRKSPKDYLKDIALFEESAEFVVGLPEK